MMKNLEEGYRAIAADKEREDEAAAWMEALIGDVAADPAESSEAPRRST
jgi:hypothetical protein